MNNQTLVTLPSHVLIKRYKTNNTDWSSPQRVVSLTFLSPNNTVITPEAPRFNQSPPPTWTPTTVSSLLMHMISLPLILLPKRVLGALPKDLEDRLVAQYRQREHVSRRPGRDKGSQRCESSPPYKNRQRESDPIDNQQPINDVGYSSQSKGPDH